MTFFSISRSFSCSWVSLLSLALNSELVWRVTRLDFAEFVLDSLFVVHECEVGLVGEILHLLLELGLLLLDGLLREVVVQHAHSELRGLVEIANAAGNTHDHPPAIIIMIKQAFLVVARL